MLTRRLVVGEAVPEERAALFKQYIENGGTLFCVLTDAAAGEADNDEYAVTLTTPVEGDYEYAFRPNPHFLAWLTLTRHADSALLIVPGRRPRLFYYQPDDYWYLPPSDPEPWWADHFTIKIARDTDTWRQTVPGGKVAAVGDAEALADVYGKRRVNPSALTQRLHLWRTRKTPYEVACMQQAARLAAVAHTEAERAFRDGETEYGIHIRYLSACKHTDTELPYNNIVALNEHGAVLHYQQRDRELPADVRSFLIDAGAAVNGYASDITRSYARQGGDFADLVVAMEAVARRMVEAVRPGIDYRELFLEATGLDPWLCSEDDLAAFAERNPSAEHVALHIAEQIAPTLPAHVRLDRIEVTEAPGCVAAYCPSR